MTDLNDWFQASQQVGRALFGNEYVARLTIRERFLLDIYGFLGRSDDEHTATLDDAQLGKVHPNDRPEFAPAWQQLRFMRWQDRIVAEWLEDHDLIPVGGEPFQIDGQKFSEAFAREFPDQKLDTTGKPDPDATIGRIGPHLGGAPRKWDWDAMHRYVISIANTPDGLPDRPKLTNMVEAWWGTIYPNGGPANSKVRDKVRDIYQALDEFEKSKAPARAAKPKS
jgi:hypothetical protein